MIVDGEGKVVVVQLHQSLGQHFTSAQGLVGKLIGLEFVASAKRGHGEVQQLKSKSQKIK